MVIFCRIISEFEAIRERALTKPEDTREMIDMLQFVKEAKTKTLVKLDSDIKVSLKNPFLFGICLSYYKWSWLSCVHLLQESFNRLSYLLDVFTFTQDDMSLNSTVLNWPNNIAPIFDQNDEVIEFVQMEISSVIILNLWISYSKN